MLDTQAFLKAPKWIKHILALGLNTKEEEVIRPNCCMAHSLAFSESLFKGEALMPLLKTATTSWPSHLKTLRLLSIALIFIHINNIMHLFDIPFVFFYHFVFKLHIGRSLSSSLTDVYLVFRRVPEIE